MTVEKRIEKLEDQFSDMQKSLYEVVAIVKSISQNVNKAINMEEKIIRLDESNKTSKERQDKFEERQSKMQESINWINLKIAWVSWAWAVIMLLVSKI